MQNQKKISSEKDERAYLSANAKISEQGNSTRSILDPKKNFREIFTSASDFERKLKQNSDFLWSVDENGNGILHLAVFSGNVELVKWVVSLDTNILTSLNKKKTKRLSRRMHERTHYYS